MYLLINVYPSYSIILVASGPSVFVIMMIVFFFADIIGVQAIFAVYTPFLSFILGL
jgi:hypothetical protein